MEEKEKEKKVLKWGGRREMRGRKEKERERV